MRKLVGIIVFLLLSGSTYTYSQDPGQRVADHPSNGVLELTLSPVFYPLPGPPPKGSDRRDDDVWRGEIRATLKNISRLTVHLVERDWSAAYGIEVLDSSGEPVALTEYGEKEKAPRGPYNPYIGPVYTFDVDPFQERSIRMNLAAIWQIKPGQAYTIRVKRAFKGDEEVDSAGKHLEGELSSTLMIEASTRVGAKQRAASSKHGRLTASLGAFVCNHAPNDLPSHPIGGDDEITNGNRSIRHCIGRTISSTNGGCP